MCPPPGDHAMGATLAKLTGVALFLVSFFCFAQACMYHDCQTVASSTNVANTVNDTFQPGDVVQVIEGPYKGETGVVQDGINYKQQTLTVRFNDGSDMEFLFSQVERIAT